MVYGVYLWMSTNVVDLVTALCDAWVDKYRCWTGSI